MTHFFSGPYNKCIKRAKWTIIVVFLSIGIAATILASKIGPLTEQEEYLPNDHPVMVL